MSPLELAEHFVNETSHSIFLTGKAGTGKTTFLRHIVATTRKRHVVVAPTGVAAINAGGVTIHSFFQLPFCPYLPDVPELVTEYQTPGRHSQLRKTKIDVLRTLELLIIDEVSMVRADLLDAIDAVLRRVRRSGQPFGGLQLLLIGDLHQLSPVVTENERPYMERVYPSPYFFYSKALKSMRYDIVELTQVFRQQDADFVALLNQVRSGHPDAATLAALNARVVPPFDESQTADNRKWSVFRKKLSSINSQFNKEPILLTTHNHHADLVNQRHLDALQGRAYTFDATIEGNFPQSAAPVDPHLVLKEGTRVMFVKNDTSGGHRYYNGKMGVVTDIDKTDDGLQVTVTDDEGDSLVVNKEQWESVRYDMAPDKSIRQQVDGVFRQLPLRLAWAVTIHKAQGLTFDRVAVDAADAFTYGQVYVALSRCRSLEGLTLRSPINARCVPDNREVDNYYQSAAPVDQLSQSLDDYRQQYRLQLLNELFGMRTLARWCERLDHLFRSHLRRLYPTQTELFHRHCETVAQLGEVSERFSAQLMRLVADGDETVLAERVAKACQYYIDTLAPLVKDWHKLSHLDIDNKEVADQYADIVAQISQLLRVRVRCLHQVLCDGFSIEKYQHSKAVALLDDEGDKDSDTVRKKSRRVEKEVANPSDAPDDLVRLLKAWRRDECQRQGIPAFHVLTQRTLLGIAAAMPTTVSRLRAVDGVGPKTVERYGKPILDIIADYRESQGLR